MLSKSRFSAYRRYLLLQAITKVGSVEKAKKCLHCCLLIFLFARPLQLLAITNNYLSSFVCKRVFISLCGDYELVCTLYSWAFGASAAHSFALDALFVVAPTDAALILCLLVFFSFTCSNRCTNQTNIAIMICHFMANVLYALLLLVFIAFRLIAISFQLNMLSRRYLFNENR